MVGDPHAEPSSSISSCADAGTGVAGAIVGACSCESCRSMMNVSLREAGVSKVRNSFVGDISFGGETLAGVSMLAGIKFPFMLASARGSIDLRRREPPRGIIDVSMA